MPTVCALCGINACKSDLPVCSDCIHELHALLRCRCGVCGKPPASCECGGPANLRFLFFFGNSASRRLIYHVKNRADERAVRFLVSLLIGTYGIDASRYDAVTYVPRRKRRVLRYGYDQSRLIAKCVADELGLPLVTTLIRRGRGEQKLLSAAERKKHIEKLFFPAEDLSEKYKGKRYLLADDISTTGATLAACAGILRRAGIASKVTAIALAKTNFYNDTGKTV